jgi:hypothetical protein
LLDFQTGINFGKRAPIMLKLKGQTYLNAFQNVHVYYKNWLKTAKESDSNNQKKFQQLWELAMIRCSSEAICDYGSALWQEQILKTKKL